MQYPDFPGVENFGTQRAPEDERAHRKKMVALGYRIFAANRWGQLGDGHVTARDPMQTDHFWILGYAIPFAAATPDDLILVGPDGSIAIGDSMPNTAGYNIHAPLYQARPDAMGAAHTHTPYGTPWSANVEPFRMLSQEAGAFVFDQQVVDTEMLEVISTDGGREIANLLGAARLGILRNHGFLTVGGSVEEAVGFFVMAERVAEAHVKAPNGKAISDAAGKVVAESMATAENGWRSFQWLVRSLDL